MSEIQFIDNKTCSSSRLTCFYVCFDPSPALETRINQVGTGLGKGFLGTRCGQNSGIWVLCQGEEAESQSKEEEEPDYKLKGKTKV